MEAYLTRNGTVDEKSQLYDLQSKQMYVLYRYVHIQSFCINEPSRDVKENSSISLFFTWMGSALQQENQRRIKSKRT